MPDRAVPRQRGIDFVAGKGEQDTGDPTRTPAEAVRCTHRLAKVPIHRSLDRSDVVEPGLDLDHQQRTRGFVERQEVDPADISAAFDPDFARNLPAGCFEAPLDVTRAQGVDRVVPTMIEHDGTLGDEVDVDPEAVEEGPDDIEAGVGGGSLDLADHLTRDTGSFAQL